MVQLNTFKLHTYEASIITALKQKLPAKELSKHICRYVEYCMQFNMRSVFTFDGIFKLELYNTKNELIYFIEYSME